MAIVCRPHRLLFIMAPRTGCSTVGKVLVESFDGVFIPAESVLDDRGFARVPRKHTALRELLDHGFLTPDERRSLFVFTTVRNPFDSLVSLYSKLKHKHQSHLHDPQSWIHQLEGFKEDIEYCQEHTFTEWIEKKYKPAWLAKLRGRGKRGVYNRYTRDADFIMRFERLQADFERALSEVGLVQKPLLPAFNLTATRDKDYRTYYDQRSRRIVEYVFERELAHFGYQF